MASRIVYQGRQLLEFMEIKIDTDGKAIVPTEDYEMVLDFDNLKILSLVPFVGKKAAAIALGRLGGAKGGPARAKALTASKRSEIAKKAAEARWNKKFD